MSAPEITVQHAGGPCAPWRAKHYQIHVGAKPLGPHIEGEELALAISEWLEQTWPAIPKILLT